MNLVQKLPGELRAGDMVHESRNYKTNVYEVVSVSYKNSPKEHFYQVLLRNKIGEVKHKQYHHMAVLNIESRNE